MLLAFSRKNNGETKADLNARLASEGFHFLTVDRFSLGWLPDFLRDFLRRGPIEPSGPEVSRKYYEGQFGEGNVRVEQAFNAQGRPLPPKNYCAVYVKPLT